jgi:molybdopterin-binding protein
MGTVMAQVVISVGEHEITAAVTRDSAEDLGPQESDAVVAIITSTEVMVGKAEA